MKTRKAFTLVELMVVIATIAILMTILLQVVGAGINAAREARTKSMLHRLKVQMEHKAQAMDRLTHRGGFLNGCIEMELLNRLGVPTNAKKPLARKLLLGHYFPQDKSEMWDANLYPPGMTPEAALLTVPIGDWLPDDDLKMVDGWNNPIAFYRWPTKLFQAHPELLIGNYNRDPEDPLCQLGGLFAASQPFDSRIGIIMPEACKVSVMVFVSPGPDGKLGMTGPLGDVTDEEAFSDNILSINLR